jgi:hypothetical protein
VRSGLVAPHLFCCVFLATVLLGFVLLTCITLWAIPSAQSFALGRGESEGEVSATA